MPNGPKRRKVRLSANPKPSGLAGVSAKNADLNLDFAVGEQASKWQTKILEAHTNPAFVQATNVLTDMNKEIPAFIRWLEVQPMVELPTEFVSRTDIVLAEKALARSMSLRQEAANRLLDLENALTVASQIVSHCQDFISTLDEITETKMTAGKLNKVLDAYMRPVTTPRDSIADTVKRYKSHVANLDAIVKGIATASKMTKQAAFATEY